MLKLIKCEFWKLKRKRLLYALMSLSLFFPLILAYMAKAGTGADTTEHYLQTRFDYVYTMMLGYGLVFLLPCLIGIIAAILFFIERDCDTSKNLRTIPVTNTQLIMAKISMLFIFSVAFCLISTLSVALFCKLFHVGMVYGMTYKIFMSLIFGVLIVAASLPIVFLITYFNQSFLLSILLAFFYSIFNWGILGTIGTSISAAKIAFLNSFPVICVMNWTSGLMMDNLQKDNLLPEAYAIVPTTFHTIFIMAITVVKDMRNIIKTEFLKLKRYSVIKAGIIMTTLSPLLSLFYSTANGGPTWTFDYFMQQVMISNCTLFFPIIIALIAGYIITREYTDDTMKNILTIPIPYKQLLSGKLLILLLLTISFSLIGCVIALVINIIVGFPGVHFGNLLNMFIRVTGANIGIYISVLPIILIFCCSANNFLGGVALAFVYGYFGTFEGTLLNYYPIKASMILVDPTCGAEYGYTYHIFPAFITIVLTFLISMIILANKKKEPGTLTVGKKKKAVRKKGW